MPEPAHALLLWRGWAACRARVLLLLPSLLQLDGKAVAPGEREQAVPAVQQEEAALAVMLHSACNVHKMVGRHAGPCHAEPEHRSLAGSCFAAGRDEPLWPLMDE